uniref:Uncharacterized protein n=1 Tax=Sphaerodactylus townsendi TaxID=933632 RepID=A0ACB8EKW1_9SAUR
MEVVAAAAGGLPARRKRGRKDCGTVSEGGARVAAADPMEEDRRSRHLALLAKKCAEDRGLEELVFGDSEEGESLLRRLQGRPSAQHGEAVSGNLLEEESCESGTDDDTDSCLLSKKPVWMDEDDEAEETIDMTHRYRKNMMKNDAESKLTKEKLQRRLQEEFQGVMGSTPSWAKRSMKKKIRKTKNEDDSEEDEDVDLLRKTGNFLTTSESLPRGILQLKKCLPANNERLSDVKLTTVQFHHSAQVVMTAGIDQSVSLFQVDGKTNPKIQSIFLEGFPVYKARFSADGEQIIATSIREKLFYIYDMMGGKIIPVNHIRGLEEKFVRKFEVSPDGSFLLISGLSGYQHLISMKTKEFVGSMKINGRAIASTFSPDGSKIYTHSAMKALPCLKRWEWGQRIEPISSRLPLGKPGRSSVTLGSEAALTAKGADRGRAGDRGR